MSNRWLVWVSRKEVTCDHWLSGRGLIEALRYSSCWLWRERWSGDTLSLDLLAFMHLPSRRGRRHGPLRPGQSQGRSSDYKRSRGLQAGRSGAGTASCGKAGSLPVPPACRPPVTPVAQVRPDLGLPERWEPQGKLSRASGAPG